MASIGNYAAALAEAARNAARSSATGIGAAIRGSATSEMPGITGAYSFAQNLRNSANSRAGSSGGGKGGGGGSASSSGPSDSSNFNAAVVRELQLMNANILEQTRLLRYQVDSNRSKSQFDEENAREQALRDSRLLDAINNIGSNSGGGPGGSGNDNGGSGGGGILSRIGSMIGGGRGGGLGGGGRGGRRGSFGGRVLKGAGVLGLGAGALYAYGRMQNGENLSDIAKDVAPGLTGAALGGLVGSIAGPLGTALGSMIGGALGDSDIGRKMFDAVLPKIQELSAAVGIDFDKIKNSFETVLLPKIKSSVENLTKIFNENIIPNLQLVSQQLLNSFESIQGTFNTKIIPGLNKLSDSSGKVLDKILSVGAREAGKVFSTGESNPLPNKIETTKRETVVSRIVKYPGESEQSYKNRLDLARWVDNQQLINSVESRKRIDIVEDVAKSNEIKAVAAGGRVKSNYFAPVTPVIPSSGGTSFERTSNASGLGFSYDSKELLNLIGKAEGGRMGYTAANKGKPGDMPQGYPQLKELTISQVMDMQKSRSGQSRSFFAVGKYQIIPDTLKGLIRGDYGPTGLTGEDYFNEENQDKLALVLIKHAEKKAKKAGGGPEAFQTEIARIWAGIGLPNTNLTNYEFNGNKASVNTSDFQKILKMDTPAVANNNTQTGSNIRFPWESTDPAKLKNIVGSGTNIVNNAASRLVSNVESIRQQIRVIVKYGEDAAKNLRSLAQSGARTANAVAPRNRPIRPILKTPEQIIAETNKNFAMQFQKIAPKAISLALRQTLFPKGIGVTQQAAGGALFRGQQLNNIFGVGKSVSKLATSLFGKQYGGMLAPALNNLATGYLEAGARAGGRLLFGMIGGMGAEQSNILTGQILGNYARGNKKLAAEQLIFGTTGVATGYETVFAKYGFKNPMEGINYMANTLGAAVSDPVNSLMNPGAKPTEYIDPRTGKKVSLNSTTSFNADAYGRIGDTSSTGATIQTVPGGDKAITTTDIESAKFAADQAYRDELIIAGISDTNRILAEGRTGSGSTAGGTLGVGGSGGGFFGAGGPLAQVGNMAFDLGRVALTQNIVKGLGVKNPYMQLLANFAINQGLKWAGQAAYSAVFGNATFTQAAGQAAGYVSNLLGFGGTQAAAPIIDGTLAAGGSTLLGTAGAATGSSSMAGAAAWSAASQGGAAGAAGGTIGAAVPQTASAAGGGGMLAGMGEAAYALAMNPATWIVAAFLVVGSLIMGSGGDPNPTIQRILWNADNNDIAKITTNWTLDWGQLDQNGQVAWIAVCDQMLKIAFNAAKAFQVKAGSLGTNIGAFDYIGTQINKFGVIIAFYRGTPQAPLGSSIDQIDFGTPEAYSKLNANEVAKRIVKKVEELYKKGVTYDAKLTEELGKTAESLQKVSYNAIASGLLSATAGQLDTSISRATYVQPEEARGPTDYNEAGPVGGSPRGVFNEKTGSWVIDAPDNVVGYDRNGNPIYDLNSDRMLSEADFKTNLADIQAIVPSATATNTGNYIAAASAAAAVAATNATSGSSGASGGSTVVAGNNSNNTTNNTTVVRQVSSVDVLRGMTTQTALPVTG